MVLSKIYPVIIDTHLYLLIGLRFSTFLAFTICVTILTFELFFVSLQSSSYQGSTYCIMPNQERLFRSKQKNVKSWLSLDPIDRSPFGHLMKFTQRSFPLYLLAVKHCLY